jgi:Tfp pilus assembly protein PilX
MRLRTRAADEQGWALITAILLMTIMLGTILSVATFTDGQTKLGADSRKRETAFNIGEAALNAQMFALSQDWAGAGEGQAGGNPYPTCTQVSTGSKCPNATALSNLIASPDTSGITWQTVVRDDGGTSQNFYSDATTLSQPAYDANNNHRLWVRSTATARGKTRTMVTLVRVEEYQEDLPHSAVIANRLVDSNNGNKVIVDMSDSTGANGFIGVRCEPIPNETTACLGQPRTDAEWPSDLVTTQLSPYDGHIQTSYTSAPIVSVSARARLRQRAIDDGTYFATCPSSLPVGADVIWIESGNCSVQSNGTTKSALLVINSGTIEFVGNYDFYGVIYAVNAQNSSGVVVSVHGNGKVYGGILVEGNGVLDAGSSKGNIVFRDNAYNSVKSYGTAGMIQNTWREIKAG